MRSIAPNILSVIERAETSGNNLVLVGQLDRKTYAAVNDVLEAVGGKWNRKAKAHVFECLADDALEQILLTGEVITRKSKQQEYGFFPTPTHIAEKVVKAARVGPGMRVLEPSAGHGAIAKVASATGADVDCFELLPENAAELQARGFHVIEADFLAVEPSAVFDAVVMNPPFAKQADIKHVTHALKFLKPGGRLAAIMSNGVTFRSDARTAAFNAMVEELGGTVAPLPEGSFKESGTTVNTIMVTLCVPKESANAV